MQIIKCGTVLFQRGRTKKISEIVPKTTRLMVGEIVSKTTILVECARIEPKRIRPNGCLLSKVVSKRTKSVRCEIESKRIKLEAGIDMICRRTKLEACLLKVNVENVSCISRNAKDCRMLSNRVRLANVIWTRSIRCST